MTTHGSQDGDQAIKNRERAFRFTSKASNGDLSEVEREMQTARYSSLEPINTMTNGVDAQHTNMHTSVVPNLSELYIESPQQQPMEPSKLDAGNKYSSSPSTDYAQSQATFVPKDMPPPRLNESSKPSHSESRSTANSNATNARYSGDELIKQRERGFRTTKVSNVSAVVGSMPVGGAEPVEPLGNVWDRATTSTNDNLIAAKISSSLEGTSSRRNGGEDIKMRERQFRAMTASNVLPKMDDDTITIHSVEPEPIESTMASSAEATWHAGVYSPRTNESISEVSQQIAPGKASGVRVHEDERMKARERQFRSTTRAVGVSREVSTKVNPSEHVAKSANVWGESTSAPANMLDKVATSPTGVLSNDVAVNQTVPGQQFRSVVVPGASAEMDNANVDILEPGAEQLIPSVSLSANPWAHSSSAPGSVAKVASARELEDAGIKARVHQFRSRRVPHISSVVETASTSDPVGPTDDETVFSESACTHSTEQASVTDSIGTARSGDRLKARMRQFRTRNAINASGVLSKLQSYESTITDVKSRAQKNALASGVGAYAVEMQGDTATFSHRGLSVVSTTSRNAAADLGVKGRVRVRKHKSKLDGKVSSVTGCPPGNTAPHEDSVDSTSLPEKGAVRMYTGGIAVQTSRGTLTPHPVVEDISVEPLAMDETRDVEEPRTVDTSANVDETVKGEQAPRSKTRTILGVCALIIVVGAIVGAVVAMSGATDKTGGTTPDVVAMSPTRSPTESPINLERMSIVRSHILNGLSTAEVLDDETSPQYAALLWITNNDKLSLIGEESSVDEIQYLLVRFVLASVYYSLDGNAWLSKRGWLDGGEDHCHWEYISCDDTTLVVTGIKTDGPANMKGSIPSEILHLTSLGELDHGYSYSFRSLSTLILLFLVVSLPKSWRQCYHCDSGIR